MNRKSFPVSAKTIRAIIGVAIMLLFPRLPIALLHVTPVGMEILGIFYRNFVFVDNRRPNLGQSAFYFHGQRFQLCSHAPGSAKRIWRAGCGPDVLLNDCYELSGT